MKNSSSNSAAPIFLTGPTASGKSGVALRLASRLEGEIISVDSMQVYRGLNIGTAKPTDQERRLVPHHLIDVVDLTESFDAAQFVHLARIAATNIQSRGGTPLFCGGTGLYFKAYLEGIGEAPPADPVLRTRLEEKSSTELLSELQQRDPKLYERIDHQNRRRVVRALEVICLSGRPYSEQRAQWEKRETTPRSGLDSDGIFVGLTRAPDDLRRRIDERVEMMFRIGLVAETEHLLASGLAENRTAMQAIGYRQVAEYLRGERTVAQTIELVKSRTRQFAKRQMTWFRNQFDLQWISIAPEETAETTAERILALRTNSGQYR